MTSLCSESDVDNGQNPFTIPVAMLLYRVARNMKHSSERRQPGTIRMLLKNCLKLLPEEKYPEIVTSSYYMLSDLFVPANTNPESPDLDQSDPDDNESVYDDDDVNDPKDSMKVLVLNPSKTCEKFSNYYKAPPAIVGGTEERCLQALLHIAAGLNCLKYFPKSSCTPEKSNQEEEVPMAKPYEAIPMPFREMDSQVETTEKKGKKKDKKKKHEKKAAENQSALLLKSHQEATPLPTWHNHEPKGEVSWKDHLKTLLYEKAVLVYAILTEHYFASGQYGTCLRNVGMLARCELLLTRLYKSSAIRENYLLGRAGDCAIMMIQNWGQVNKHTCTIEKIYNTYYL